MPRNTKPTDSTFNKMLQAFGKGDERAFDYLFLTYQPKLLYFIEGFVKDHEQARDLSQEIFISLWNDRKNCSHITNFKSYLFQMARHAIYNYFDHCLVNEKYVKEILSAPISFDSTEEKVFAVELQEMINLLVSHMPKQRQRIYRMSREQGISNEDIARELNISKRTVENQLSHALAQIRQLSKIMMILLNIP